METTFKLISMTSFFSRSTFKSRLWSNCSSICSFICSKNVKIFTRNQQYFKLSSIRYNLGDIQARIAQLVAYRLGTWEVSGSNPGKGENFSVKISNWNISVNQEVLTNDVKEPSLLFSKGRTLSFVPGEDRLKRLVKIYLV